MKMQTMLAGAALLISTATIAMADEDTVKEGQSVFQGTCIVCHGADGKGVLPGAPDFTKPGGRLSKSDATLLDHITNGFQSPGSMMAMPPKGGNPALTESKIRAAIQYLRATFGSKSS